MDAHAYSCNGPTQQLANVPTLCKHFVQMLDGLYRGRYSVNNSSGRECGAYENRALDAHGDVFLNNVVHAHLPGKIAL